MEPGFQLIQLWRGSEAARTTHTPARGEFMYSQDANELYIGDAARVGGHLVHRPPYSLVSVLGSDAPLDVSTGSNNAYQDIGLTVSVPHPGHWLCLYDILWDISYPAPSARSINFNARLFRHPSISSVGRFQARLITDSESTVAAQRRKLRGMVSFFSDGSASWTTFDIRPRFSATTVFPTSITIRSGYTRLQLLELARP